MCPEILYMDDIELFVLGLMVLAEAMSNLTLIIVQCNLYFMVQQF